MGQGTNGRKSDACIRICVHGARKNIRNPLLIRQMSRIGGQYSSPKIREQIAQQPRIFQGQEAILQREPVSLLPSPAGRTVPAAGGREEEQGSGKEYGMYMSEEKRMKWDELSPDDRMKYEIAEELGLLEKVREQGWKSLSAKETGRIGGLMTKRKRRGKSS